MYSPSEQPGVFTELDSQAKALIREFLPKLGLNGERKTLLSGTDLFAAELNNPPKFYYIEEGTVALCNEDRVVAYIENGDFLGLVSVACAGVCTLKTDFAVKVVEYSAPAYIEAVCATPALAKSWHQYLSLQQGLMSVMLGSALKSESRLHPDVSTHQKGAVIIRQGDAPDNVYTLLEGRCDVTVDGVKVAEINRDEIFGAMSIIIDAPRTATVVATERSVVMAVRKEKFLDLIESRPGTTFKLIEDLTRIIVGLNKVVVGKAAYLS